MSGYVSEENSGVFAGYLDVSYDDAFASVAGDIVHGPLYRNAKSGDLSTPGLLDDIGAFVGDFARLGMEDFGLHPIGLGDKLLFDVPFTANAVGALNFVGTDSGTNAQHHTLVYGVNEPVIDADIIFGSAQLNVVPEPQSAVLLGCCLLGLFLRFRRTYDFTFPQTR